MSQNEILTEESRVRTEIVGQSLKIRYPDIFKQINRTKTPDVDFENLMLNTNLKLWWICSNNEPSHTWEASVDERVQGECCPHRETIEPRKPILLRNRHPEIFAQIIKDENTRDVDLNALTFISSKRLQWRCSDNTCGCHVWMDSVYNRVNKRRCPFCEAYGPECRYSDDVVTNEMLSKEFDDELNPNIDRKKVVHPDNTEIWWRCSNHSTCDKHVWKETITSRKSSKLDCPFCTEKETCPCNSFINSRLLKALADDFDFQHPENENIDPYTLNYLSDTIVRWTCSLCKFSWRMSIESRSLGDGCPVCEENNVKYHGCFKYLEDLGYVAFPRVKIQYLSDRRFSVGYDSNLIEIDNLTYPRPKGFVETQQVKTFIPLILGFSVLKISSDNDRHIRACVDGFIEVTSLPDRPSSFVVFDDVAKYDYLFSGFTVKTVKDFCDSDYFDEIVDRLKDFHIVTYDLKTGVAETKHFNLNNGICHPEF